MFIEWEFIEYINFLEHSYLLKKPLDVIIYLDIYKNRVQNSSVLRNLVFLRISVHQIIMLPYSFISCYISESVNFLKDIWCSLHKLTDHIGLMNQ